MKDKSNVLLYLLPAKRDVQLTTLLRRARQYPTVYAQTNRYKNFFIVFGAISCMHKFLYVCLVQPFEAKSNKRFVEYNVNSNPYLRWNLLTIY